jgi:hypothetical protein
MAWDNFKRESSPGKYKLLNMNIQLELGMVRQEDGEISRGNHGRASIFYKKFASVFCFVLFCFKPLAVLIKHTFPYIHCCIIKYPKT